MHKLTNTSKVRVNGRPNSHTALPEALANGELQVQQWDTLQHEQDKKRDHKSSWRQAKDRCMC